VLLTFVILDARDELFVFIVEFNVSTLDAMEEDVDVFVALTVLILAAKEALLFDMLLASPSILNAADELFVEIVELKVVTEEFNEADAA
jgi:hypothetical protein